MREQLQDAFESLVEAWQRLSPRAQLGVSCAAAAPFLYLAVAAFLSTVAFPSYGPPVSDLPHAGMMMVQRDIKSTFVLRRTSADTSGAFVELDLLMDAAGGPGTAGSHMHPDVDERLQVLEGTAIITVDGVDHVVPAGNQVRIAKGVSHGIRNASDRFALVRGRFEPASNMDRYYLQVDRAGGFSGAGRVRMAVLATWFDQQYPGWAPLWLSKAGVQLIAPTARLLGVRSYYPPAV